MATFTLWELAKEILIVEISEGRVTKAMGPKHTYSMKEEYRRVDYTRFRANLNNLHIALSKVQGRADVDEAAVAHDRMLYPINVDNPSASYPRWGGSESARLLKIDIDNDLHLTMTPKQLRLFEDRPYRLFPLEVFRRHIHQEVRSRISTAYWMVKQQNKRRAARIRKLE
jgi:hypothetical protein